MFFQVKCYYPKRIQFQSKTESSLNSQAANLLKKMELQGFCLWTSQMCMRKISDIYWTKGIWVSFLTKTASSPSNLRGDKGEAHVSWVIVCSWGDDPLEALTKKYRQELSNLNTSWESFRNFHGGSYQRLFPEAFKGTENVILGVQKN